MSRVKTKQQARPVSKFLSVLLLTLCASWILSPSLLHGQPSRVPHYTFPTTMEEQEAALRTNPLMQRFAESREKLSADPHRPIFHFVNPEGRLNDPNGFSFWNGNWHLFYQAYPPEDPRQHWGHAISKDLVHWRDLPLAIYLHPEHASYSGSIWVEEDRALAHYHGTRVGNMVAVSDDPLLLNWKKVTGKAVIPKKNRDTLVLDGQEMPHHVYDPFLWKEDGMYYSISGWRHWNEETRAHFPTAELYRSPDLENWEYVHQFIEGDVFTAPGTDAACPYFWPIGDRHIFLFFSHHGPTGGGQYWLGDYDRDTMKFHATAHGNFNHGAIRPGGVHAPSAFPDGKGGVITIFNINDAKPTQGWNHIMSLPIRLTLADDDKLHMEPAGDIEAIRSQPQSVAPQPLKADEELVLQHIRGDAMEFNLEIDPKDATIIELNVFRSPDRKERTRILFHTDKPHRGAKSTLSIVTDESSTLSNVRRRPPENAPFDLKEGETLQLRVFIDRSVVEVFANGRQYAAVRVYPGLEESTGVSLLSHGGESELLAFDAWEMMNTWDISLDEWHAKDVWR